MHFNCTQNNKKCTKQKLQQHALVKKYAKWTQKMNLSVSKHDIKMKNVFLSVFRTKIIKLNGHENQRSWNKTVLQIKGPEIGYPVRVDICFTPCTWFLGGHFREPPIFGPSTFPYICISDPHWPITIFVP